MDPSIEKKAALLARTPDPEGIAGLCHSLRSVSSEACSDGLCESLFKIGTAALAAGAGGEALELFGFCLRRGFKAQEAKELIIEKFYKPFETQYRGVYEKNMSNLAGYAHIRRKDFPAFENLKYLFLPYGGTGSHGEARFAMLDSGTGDFKARIDADIAPAAPAGSFNHSGEVVLLNDIFDAGFILRALEGTHEKKILTMKVPLFAYYNDFFKFAEFLQLFDFEKCLAAERVVFVFGRQEFFDTILHKDIMPPVCQLSSPGAEERAADEMLREAVARKNADGQNMWRRIVEGYLPLTPALISRMIAEKRSRIAFITTRFSTAIQFFARDCVMALNKLGYNAKLVIENSDIEFNHKGMYLRFFSTFKPDIIFCIDNNRSLADIPPQAVFVCWIQDFLPALFSREGAAGMGPCDFVMNLFFSGNEFEEFGYPPGRMIDAPMPVNQDIYRSYELTAEERALYSADVCYISNSGDIESSFCAFMNFFIEDGKRDVIEKKLRALTDRIFDDIYNERRDYYDTAFTSSLLREELEKISPVRGGENFAGMARAFKFELISDIQKVVPLLWLHEKGYRMKLWGKPWPKHPILGKYAMGVAPNGETMSKILNASRISIGQNNAITLHPRLMEAILSGSLYIGNDIPEKFDLARAEKYLAEGDDYLKFRGREDLYRKIDRHLADEGERARIVSNGKRRILGALTSERLMQNVLDFIHRRLAEMS